LERKIINIRGGWTAGTGLSKHSVNWRFFNLDRVSAASTVLKRHTEPDKDVQAMLDYLHMTLASQPPRVKASHALPLPKNEPATQPSLW
jgi:hypothetical protein